MSGLSNRPSLASVRTMPVGEVAALPADHLALLQEDAAAELEASKRQKDGIDGAIALRFAGRAEAERRAVSKDTGTVRFEEDGVIVVADLPKKVEWEQRLIADVVERIRAAGDDPVQYVEITIKVPERKYAAWPDSIRAAFAPARTVKTSKQTFKLSLSSEEATRTR